MLILSLSNLNEVKASEFNHQPPFNEINNFQHNITKSSSEEPGVSTEPSEEVNNADKSSSEEPGVSTEPSEEVNNADKSSSEEPGVSTEPSEEVNNADKSSSEEPGVSTEPSEEVNNADKSSSEEPGVSTEPSEEVNNADKSSSEEPGVSTEPSEEVNNADKSSSEEPGVSTEPSEEVNNADKSSSEEPGASTEPSEEVNNADKSSSEEPGVSTEPSEEVNNADKSSSEEPGVSTEPSEEVNNADKSSSEEPGASTEPSEEVNNADKSSSEEPGVITKSKEKNIDEQKMEPNSKNNDKNSYEDKVDVVLNNKDLNEIAKKYTSKNSSEPTKPKGNQGVVKKNKNPIILVHGFSGYSDDNRPPLFPSYWGGKKVDLDKELSKQGYKVMEAGVSPFGSGHDRAIELYYYIKGGRVDYGAYHSQKYGFNRYGKTYPGIYPDWEPGKKLHLVGHSFGGPTIQILEDLLRNGDPNEIAYHKKYGGEISPLLQGGNNDMVSSLTTVAGPHNGSLFAEKVANRPIVRKAIFDFVTLRSHKYNKMDYGYDHWGLKQKDDETFFQYLKRVKGNDFWKTENYPWFDGTLEQSKKLNDRLTMNKDIAYVSITGLDTHKDLFGKQKANSHMLSLLKFIGNFTGRQHPESWQKNDGPISLASGLFPYNKPFKETTFDEKPELGIWNVMPTYTNWDHMDLVGWGKLDKKVTPKMVLGLYEELFNYLSTVEELQK